MTKHYDKYVVGLAERFDAGNHKAVVEEISIINKRIDTIPVHFQREIIISFLKDHSLQNIWINANPELTELVTSQTLFTGSIESLFDSCRDNPVFRQGLEDYLKEKLTGNVRE